MCMWIVVLTQAMHFSLFVLRYSTRAQQYSFKTKIASLVTFKVAATQEHVFRCILFTAICHLWNVCRAADICLVYLLFFDLSPLFAPWSLVLVRWH